MGDWHKGKGKLSLLLPVHRMQHKPFWCSYISGGGGKGYDDWALWIASVSLLTAVCEVSIAKMQCMFRKLLAVYCLLGAPFRERRRLYLLCGLSHISSFLRITYILIHYVALKRNHRKCSFQLYRRQENWMQPTEDSFSCLDGRRKHSVTAAQLLDVYPSFFLIAKYFKETYHMLPGFLLLSQGLHFVLLSFKKWQWSFIRGEFYSRCLISVEDHIPGPGGLRLGRFLEGL